jgi:hypothetical protein
MHLQVCIVFIWERHLGGIGHLLLVLLKNGLVNLDLGRSEGWRSDELKGLVADQLSGKPANEMSE